MGTVPERFPVDVLHVKAKVNHRNGKQIALLWRGMTRDASDFDESHVCTSLLYAASQRQKRSSFDLQ